MSTTSQGTGELIWSGVGGSGTGGSASRGRGGDGAAETGIVQSTGEALTRKISLMRWTWIGAAVTSFVAVKML